MKSISVIHNGLLCMLVLFTIEFLIYYNMQKYNKQTIHFGTQIFKTIVYTFV